MDCPVALALERVGEWWSILILRDALQGSTRFEDFRASLDISPTILTRRLTALVEGGLLERRRYSARPPRHEYILTSLGRDFSPVLISLFAWGTRNLNAPRGIHLVNKETGRFAVPIIIDRETGEPITGEGYKFVAGPDASDATLRRLPPGPDVTG